MNNKWDINKVKSFVDENSKCELISKEYNGYSGELQFKCSCGDIFTKKWSKFKLGQMNCKKCGRQRTTDIQKKTGDGFNAEVFKLVGDEYVFIDEYKGAQTKIKVRHNECGNTYEVTPTAFLSKGRRCPKCNGGVAKSKETFINQIAEQYGDEFSLVGEYNGSRNHAKILHHNCGYTFDVTPDNFLHKNSLCPLCSSSKGEKIIANFLHEKGVCFKTQHSFENMTRLKYDFMINVHGEMVLIEFDGIQHYEPVNFFGGIEKFKKQQIRDKKKTDFCNQNKIRLIRIPYWEVEKIDTILSDIL